jgi:hypothetical protein
MRYRFDKLELTPRERRSASWTFGTKPVTGIEHGYGLTDHNLTRQNQWEFVVRIPKDPKGRIEVRPMHVPDDRAWAGLDRRGLTFMPATRRGYTGYRYCQISLPSNDGKASRHVMHRDQIDRLPYWIRDLGPKLLRNKITVTTTRAKDDHSLVALVRRDDYQAMIAMYMATKAWVLKAGKAIKV